MRNGEANVGGGTRSRDERGQFNHQEGRKRMFYRKTEGGEIMMMMQKKKASSVGWEKVRNFYRKL